MEPGLVPHDNLSTIQPRDELCALMAVGTYPEVLDDPDGCSWFESNESKGNDEPLAVLGQCIRLVLLFDIKQHRCGARSVLMPT
uniref:Uncharacterized protein n=1 Tax=Oryza brachyantha TaxID=4533 RepID=J3N5R6_ORYBR